MAKRIKGTTKRILERQFQTYVIQLIPEAPELLQKLANQAESYDGSEPMTFLNEIENDWGDVGEKLKVRAPQFQQRFQLLLRKPTTTVLFKNFVSEQISFAKKSAATDKRYSLLLKLMHDTDERVPFGSLILAHNYAEQKALYYPDAKAYFVAQSTAFSVYKRAECVSGEARAGLALEAFAKTVELVYKPYLTSLWLLLFVKLGKPLPSHLPTLGSMLDVILRRLREYPGLVDPDAVWMRNSAVHCEPRYILGEDSLWMGDGKHLQRLQLIT